MCLFGYRDPKENFIAQMLLLITNGVSVLSIRGFQLLVCSKNLLFKLKMNIKETSYMICILENDPIGPLDSSKWCY